MVGRPRVHGASPGNLEGARLGKPETGQGEGSKTQKVQTCHVCSLLRRPNASGYVSRTGQCGREQFFRAPGRNLKTYFKASADSGVIALTLAAIFSN